VKSNQNLIGTNTMTEKQSTQYPWFVQPVVIFWAFLASILKLTGRVVGAIIGLVLMIVGIILGT
jgi:predicted permease